MRTFRTILRTIITFSILVWCVGVVMGRSEEKPLYWEAATYSVWGMGGATLLLLLTLPFGLNLPEAQPRKLKKRASEHYGKGIKGAVKTAASGKCLDCGRPVIPGSDYCKYHTDLRKEERNRGRV